MTMTTTKLTAIGDGLGVVLPTEALRQLQGTEGDEVQVVVSPTGIAIHRMSPADTEQLAVAERVMREDQTVLRKLAE